MKRLSYLSSLKFDNNLWNKWFAKYLLQFRLVILFLLVIIVTGVFAYLNLPRRLNPEINIAIIVVNTVLPGASPEDVEQLVTIPLEDSLENVDDIDTMTSTSLENVSTVAMQFKSNVDADKAKDQVQSEIDSVQLPEDARDPTVSKIDFEDEPVWYFTLTSKSDTPSLMRFAKDLKDEIESNSKIDRVVTSGLDEQNIEVVVDQEKIRDYNLSPFSISQAISKNALSYPSGIVETTESTFALTIDKNINSIEDIRNIQIPTSSENISLGSIADVVYISKPNQNQSFLASKNLSPTKAVHFFVYRTATSNINEAQQQAERIVDREIKIYDNQFQTTTITNFAEDTSEEFNDLLREFNFTMLLVFLVLLIFLGLRQALIASIVVPLTFLSSFAIIYALGLSLNFLTMFSFLIALGVLIDDAIVVVAASTRYFATNKFTPAEAGVLVWRDFIVPLISTTATTAWAFVPLLLSTGIIGEFIKTIPIVVTVTMLASTAIALFITLPLMIIFLKPSFPPRVKIFLRILLIILLFSIPLIVTPKNAFLAPVLILFATFLFVVFKTRKSLILFIKEKTRKYKIISSLPSLIKRISGKGLLNIENLAKIYMSVIDRILVSRHGKRNTLIAIALFTILAYFLVPLGLVKNEFFPKVDSNIVYMSVDMPAGTKNTTVKNEMLSMLDVVKNTNEVKYIAAETGQNFSSQSGGRSSSNNSFLLTLHLTDIDERKIESFEIAESIREKFRHYDKGTLTVQEQSGGPPAGADVQITILGNELSLLDQYADSAMKFLETQSGVTNINKSIKSGTSKIVFAPNKNLLSQNNVSVDQIGLSMRTYASGFELDKIRFGEDEEDVIFKMGYENQTPEDLGKLSIISPSGSVPLLSLGSLTLESNPTIITREDGKKTITISGSVVSGFNAGEINQKLINFVDNELNMNPGYSSKTGGVNEENQESVNSILQAMILSFILILITMVIEFKSFRQTFIALMFIPISISGVFYVFALTNTPLSFPSLIGILALFGIVVRHAIVVIEKINEDLREGMDLKSALVDASGNRLEPILLTSLTAIVGLIPITISDPLWRGLGGAIIAGLLFSGLIKLFFVPVVFYLLFNKSKTS